MTAAVLAGCGAGLALAFVAWLASLPLRDASIADRLWPWLVLLPAMPSAALLQARGGWGARTVTLLVLALAWALRLCIHITWRNWGRGEDPRYAAMRAAAGPGFALRSLATVFLLQALLAMIVCAPLLAAFAAPQGFGALDALGTAIAAFGIVFESVADAQLARFRANPGSRGHVLRSGLWRWSRHPNYFGEACVWWGLALVALGGAGLHGAWVLVSPLLMTVLLLRVSGVRLLERDLAGRRPGYRAYMRATSAFVPWPPRRSR
jgi:steroid 5-alpha reductase family enzyme